MGITLQRTCEENETIVHGLMKIFQDLYVFRDLYLGFYKTLTFDQDTLCACIPFSKNE